MNEQEQQSGTPSEGGEDQGAGKKRRRRRRRSRRPGEDGPQGSEQRAEGETSDEQGDDDDSDDEGGAPSSDGNGQAAQGDDARKKKRRKKKKRPEGQPASADGAPGTEQHPREPREPREQQPREQREPREPREPRAPREQQQREPREPREPREQRQPREPQQRRSDGNRPQQGAKPEADKPARAPRGSVLARRAQRLDMGVHRDDVEEQVVPAGPVINTSSVDAYVNSHRGWQREVLMKLRDMIRACAAEATENISWSQPVFDLNGPMCYLKAFTDHVNFGFWRGTELDDPEGLLVGDLTKMRHVKIASVNDVKRDRFEAFIRQAAKLNREKGDPTA